MTNERIREFFALLSPNCADLPDGFSPTVMAADPEDARVVFAAHCHDMGVSFSGPVGSFVERVRAAQ